ncbi:Hypothetical_protein [Hexamita inflata]|uniref:Hypothetical_protein n=1 Tax=Hexamita inflata TaxID=28002 RepID=A0AA86U7I0_9EUKA|nr:Hypothetical protein HINF_LOCUS18864 [Hexamita inflata]CAI9942086.1 Hypothetical protein HINF_LOCUS29731 [Hexamita inflata]
MQIVLSKQEQSLVDILSRLLKSSCPIQLSYNVLALPDTLENKLFELLSSSLQINTLQLRDIFNKLVFKCINALKTQQITINPLVQDSLAKILELKEVKTEYSDIQQQQTDIQPKNRNIQNKREPASKVNIKLKNEGVQDQQLTQQCYNLHQNKPRTQSKESIQFQNRFSSCLQVILQIQETDNKIVCEKVLSHLQQNSSKKFWKQITELIPEKTTIQLREYFQNSFKRFMHQEYLNKTDKIILQSLILEMKDKKPAEIAEKFMEMTAERNYFKRNVIMYIVNLKEQ